MATLIDGKALAERIRSEVAAQVAELGPIGLATVLVGDDAASDIYIRLKHKASNEVGIESRDLRLPAETSQAELLRVLGKLNADDGIDGLLVQLPLPDHIDEARVIRAIEPVKDVDGLHPVNAGLLAHGSPEAVVPCTPAGVMELLRRSGAELAGAQAVVIGRSTLVGRPLASLLLSAHATVTHCHSRTRNLAAVCREADVIVAAAGVARLVSADMVSGGATVIDVGTNRTDDGLVGDVDFEPVSRVARAITPVPGGVGPMTIAMLLRNTVRAARRALPAGEMPAAASPATGGRP